VIGGRGGIHGVFPFSAELYFFLSIWAPLPSFRDLYLTVVLRVALPRVILPFFFLSPPPLLFSSGTETLSIFQEKMRGPCHVFPFFPPYSFSSFFPLPFFPPTLSRLSFSRRHSFFPPHSDLVPPLLFFTPSPALNLWVGPISPDPPKTIIRLFSPFPSFFFSPPSSLPLHNFEESAPGLLLSPELFFIFSSFLFTT